MVSDISEAAIRVTASAYIFAALKLDPQPTACRAPVRPLIGRRSSSAMHALFETTSDTALTTPKGLKKIHVIVGNPPWSFKGQAGTAARRRLKTRALLSR